ncbi:MAG: hypothetical protein WCR95_00890 [Eubacteriales bacterium]
MRVVKNRLLFTTLAVFLMLALVLPLVGCGGGSSSLVGEWYSESEDFTIEFSKDGTGSWGGFNITWEVKSSRLHITFYGETEAFKYSVSGSKLTLVNPEDDDDVVELTKVNKGLDGFK